MPQWPSAIFKTNPVIWLWSDVPLTAEYRLAFEYINGQHESTEIAISYLGKSPLLKMFEEELGEDIANLRVFGFRIQASHRFFLNDLFPNLDHTHTNYSPQGIYIAPHFSLASARITTRYLGARQVFMELTHFSANVLIGRQYFYSDHYTLDVFGGLGYKRNTWKEHDQQNVLTFDPGDTSGYYFSPIKIIIGFNMGIYF